MTAQTEYIQVKRCACGNVRLAARAITNFYDNILQPSGLRTTQFSLLTTIARVEEITISQLADLLVMDQTTMTRNLRPLEKQALVERTVGPDQRTRLLKLTDQGRQVLEIALPLWEQAQAQAVAHLGQERFRSLLKDLSELAEVGSR